PIKRYKVRKLLGKDAGISSPLKKAVVAVFSVIPLKTLDKGVKFFMTVSGKNNGEYVTNWGSQYNYDRKATFKREIFGEPEHLTFEGIDIEVPHDYESMLIQIYGDYMKLPPEDKRVTHGVSLAGCEDVDMETIRARVESKKVKE
ncbi:MAG: LicD family protein, partial [Acutalibacteraceae bacterium]